jgi:hypothetical protein
MGGGDKAKNQIALIEEEEDVEALSEAPDWLPDGWIMEVYRGDDGIIHRVSVISNFRSYQI